MSTRAWPRGTSVLGPEGKRESTRINCNLREIGYQPYKVGNMSNSSSTVNWDVTSSSTAGQDVRSSDSSNHSRPQWRATVAIQEEEDENAGDFHSTGSIPENFDEDAMNVVQESETSDDNGMRVSPTRIQTSPKRQASRSRGGARSASPSVNLTKSVILRFSSNKQSARATSIRRSPPRPSPSLASPTASEGARTRTLDLDDLPSPCAVRPSSRDEEPPTSRLRTAASSSSWEKLGSPRVKPTTASIEETIAQLTLLEQDLRVQTDNAEHDRRVFAQKEADARTRARAELDEVRGIASAYADSAFDQYQKTQVYEDKASHISQIAKEELDVEVRGRMVMTGECEFYSNLSAEKDVRISELESRSEKVDAGHLEHHKRQAKQITSIQASLVAVEAEKAKLHKQLASAKASSELVPSKDQRIADLEEQLNAAAVERASKKAEAESLTKAMSEELKTLREKVKEQTVMRVDMDSQSAKEKEAMEVIDEKRKMIDQLKEKVAILQAEKAAEKEEQDKLKSDAASEVFADCQEPPTPMPEGEREARRSFAEACDKPQEVSKAKPKVKPLNLAKAQPTKTRRFRFLRVDLEPSMSSDEDEIVPPEMKVEVASWIEHPACDVLWHGISALLGRLRRKESVAWDMTLDLEECWQLLHWENKEWVRIAKLKEILRVILIVRMKDDCTVDYTHDIWKQTLDTVLPWIKKLETLLKSGIAKGVQKLIDEHARIDALEKDDDEEDADAAVLQEQADKFLKEMRKQARQDHRGFYDHKHEYFPPDSSEESMTELVNRDDPRSRRDPNAKAVSAAVKAKAKQMAENYVKRHRASGTTGEDDIEVIEVEEEEISPAGEEESVIRDAAMQFKTKKEVIDFMQKQFDDKIAEILRQAREQNKEELRQQREQREWDEYEATGYEGIYSEDIALEADDEEYAEYWDESTDVAWKTETDDDGEGTDSGPRSDSEASLQRTKRCIGALKVQKEKQATPSNVRTDNAMAMILGAPSVRRTEAEAKRKTRITVRTQLKEPIKKGDTKIHLKSYEGINIGDMIKLQAKGVLTYEIRKVRSFGSITVDKPFMFNYEADNEVLVVEYARPRLRGGARSRHREERTIDADGSTTDAPTNSGGTAGNYSDSSTATKDKTLGPKSIKLPTLPKYAKDVSSFMMELGENILAETKRSDRKELEFAHEVTLLKITSNRLDMIPERFAKFDRALMQGIMERVKNHPELAREIKDMKTILCTEKKLMAARRALAMILFHFATDDLAIESLTINAITNMKWQNYGDEKAYDFLRDWLNVTTQLDHPLDDRHLRDMLYYNLQQSTALKLPLLDYSKTSKKHRTYQQLIEIFRIHLVEQKEKQNVERQRQGMMMIADGSERPNGTRRQRRAWAAAAKQQEAEWEESPEVAAAFAKGKRKGKKGKDGGKDKGKDKGKGKDEKGKKGKGKKGKKGGQGSGKGDWNNGYNSGNQWQNNGWQSSTWQGNDWSGKGNRWQKGYGAVENGKPKGDRKGKDKGSGKTGKEGKPWKSSRACRSWEGSNNCNKKFNGDRVCQWGKNCKFDHKDFKSQKEFDDATASYTPAASEAGTQPNTPRAEKIVYCRKFNECPGRPIKSGGDGTCSARHGKESQILAVMEKKGGPHGTVRYNSKKRAKSPSQRGGK